VAAAAGATAAVLAMPALVVEPREVWARMLWQRDTYDALRIGSYWDQAVRYAEWDLPAQSAELGLTFLALALAGLAVGVAAPRWRRPALGWLLFGALLVGLHARYAFQAFRNLLPLAALGCVAFALLVAWAGERLRRPRLAAVLASAVLLALFARPHLAYAPEPRYLLAPSLDGEHGPLIAAADQAPILDRYEIKATFGEATGSLASIFRGNRLRIYVLERRPGARRSFNAASKAETGANSSSGKLSALSQNSPSPPAPHDS
jgi:hypothetical protein